MRFEMGVSVEEFRDLRANARCVAPMCALCLPSPDIPTPHASMQVSHRIPVPLVPDTLLIHPRFATGSNPACRSTPDGTRNGIRRFCDARNASTSARRWELDKQVSLADPSLHLVPWRR